MIAAIENAMLAALQAQAGSGTLGYVWRELESYPDDFDEYLKLKGQLRTPAAWAVFLSLDQCRDEGDAAEGVIGTARFALVVAAKNLRNETATRHGGIDQASEPGSYQLAEDAMRILSRSDLGLKLLRPLTIGGARLVARTPEIRTQGLSLMAIELSCDVALGALPTPEGALADFAQLHVDWDVPAIGNVTAPLPAAEADAEDLVEIPQ